MTWATLLPNQFVSLIDASNSGLPQKWGPPQIEKFMTKDEAIYYLSVNEANLNGLSGNQWVWKSLLTTSTVYSSAAYSESATRNNCGAGSTPTTVTLVSPYGQFSNYQSQANADTTAVSWVQANKQDYANSYGQCILISRTKAWRGIAPFCVQVVEVRPYPMVDLSLFYTKHIGTGAYTYFADTLANATQAYADFASTVYSISGGSYQMVSVAVGNRCYVNAGGSSLSGPADGYYLTGNFDRKVYHFVSSILTAIISI